MPTSLNCACSTVARYPRIYERDQYARAAARREPLVRVVVRQAGWSGCPSGYSCTSRRRHVRRHSAGSRQLVIAASHAKSPAPTQQIHTKGPPLSIDISMRRMLNSLERCARSTSEMLLSLGQLQWQACRLNCLQSLLVALGNVLFKTVFNAPVTPTNLNGGSSPLRTGSAYLQKAEISWLATSLRVRKRGAVIRWILSVR